MRPRRLRAPRSIRAGGGCGLTGGRSEASSPLGRRSTSTSPRSGSTFFAMFLQDFHPTVRCGGTPPRRLLHSARRARGTRTHHYAGSRGHPRSLCCRGDGRATRGRQLCPSLTASVFRAFVSLCMGGNYGFLPPARHFVAPPQHTSSSGGRQVSRRPRPQARAHRAFPRQAGNPGCGVMSPPIGPFYRTVEPCAFRADATWRR